MSRSELRAEIRQLKAEVEARSRAKTYARYRSDPAGYITDVLGQAITPDQRELCRLAVTPPYRVLARSANNVGKTWLAGALVNWWYDCHPQSICLTTAPVYAQVVDGIWKNVRTLRAGRGGFPGPKIPRLESSPEHFATGFTASSATAFQGRHERNVMVILDEAEGVDPEIWDAVETMVGGDCYCQVALYNPTTSTARTVQEERSGKYHLHTMSALNHPNIADEANGKPARYPGAIRLQRLREQLERWSEKIPEHEPGAVQLPGSDQWYRPGPLAEARLLGRRPSKAFDAIWTDTFIDLCCTLVLPPLGRIQIGIDPARFGMDYTVFHARRGGRSIGHVAYNGLDTVEVANRAIKFGDDLLRDSKLSADQIVYVVDDIGLGGGVTDNIRRSGRLVVPVNTGTTPSWRPGQEAYPNLRSALWFGLAEEASKGNVSWVGLSIEVQAALREQFTAVRYYLDAQGRRVAEDKDQTRAKLGRSPDDADAVMLAYANVAAGR